MAEFNNVDTFAELRDAITGSKGNGQADTINITGDIALTDLLPLIEEDTGLTINGGSAFISGNNARHLFFVKSGTVTFDSLTFQDGLAQGGSGSGGGAGMGGALFVYDGTVSVANSAFVGNQAIGGEGGVSDFGGRASFVDPNIGLMAEGMPGASGIPGGNGGNGGNGDFFGPGGVGGVGGFYGGRGGDGGRGGFGAPAGIGGRGGDGSYGGYGGTGSEGGFGGGGSRGGSGGFGGEGEGGYGGYGGDGGYGGGGGYGGAGGGGTFGSGSAGNDGFGGFGGGGDGTLNSDGGGGGAGMGGAIFMRSGSLTVANSSFTSNSATGGTGSTNGKGLGGAIFAMKSTGTNTPRNGNNQGMPSSLPTVTLNGVAFSGNTAADNSSSPSPDFDDDDLFGSTITIGGAPVDMTAPILSSFKRKTPLSSTTNADTLVFSATFSEAVKNINAADFSVTGTTATIVSINPVGTSAYDITVAGGDLANLNGTIGLDLAAGQNITDLAGNALLPGEPAIDEIYTLDNTVVIPPTVEFSAGTFTASEGVGTSQAVTLTRTGNTSGISIVQVSITGGTATGAGTDYTSSSFPLTVTFAAGETTKTVDIPIIDDNLVEGDETILFSVAALTNATLGTQSTATLTITDNDVPPPPSPTIEFSAGTFTVSEGVGTSQAVTLTRTGDTTSTSTVQVSIAGGTATGTDYTSSFPLTVTFAAGEITKTVDIPITDDSLVESSETIFLSVASSTNATIGTQSTATLTITDNDSPGFTLSKTNATVSEAGTTDQFAIILNSQPSSDVVLNIVSSDIGEATVTPASVIFTNANWNTAALVTITGVDDVEVDGEQTSTLTVSVDAALSNDAFDSLLPQTISVTTTDNDSPGFTLSKTSATVSEAGTTDQFTVTLNSQPSSNVVLTIVSNDLSEATVAPASVTLNSTNWNTGELVTITGADDAEVDGNQTSTLIISVDAALSDDAFDSLSPQTISVITTDDDVPPPPSPVIEFSAGAFAVSEGVGTSQAVTLTRTGDISSPSTVEVSIASGGTATDGTDYTSSSFPLTVTFAAGETTKTVDIPITDDSLAESSETIFLSVASPTNATIGTQSTATLTITDNDSPGFTLSKTSATVSEAGTIDQFTVTLNSQPSSDVVLTIVSNDLSEATVAPTSVTLNSTNWNTGELVTITGVDDAEVDGNQTSTLTINVAPALSDDAFDSLSAQTVSVITTDDDVPPPPSPVIEFSAGAFAVSEGVGTSQAVTLTRIGDTSIISTVEVSIASGGTATDGNDYTSSSFPLTVTFAAGETTKTVDIPITDDSLAESSETIFLSVASPTNATIGTQSTATLTITDNDSPGFTLSKTSATVSEAGTTDQFTVTLNSQPSSDVVLTIVSNDLGEATVAPTSISLNSTNWNTGELVTITGADDAEVDGNQTSTLTISVDAGSSDDAFDSLSPQTIFVITTDDDVSPTPTPPPTPGPSSQLTPIAATKVLEVTQLGTANTINLQLQQVGIDSVSELLIFSTDALGNSRTQIGSFSLLRDGQLNSAYDPEFTLNNSQVAAGEFLQFELVQDGVARVATPTANSNGQIELDFGGGTRLLASLANYTSNTNLLRDDAATIDLTGVTDPLSMEFMVYREAAFNNTVGLYRTDDASGGITDALTGAVIKPGEAGYKEAAIARQLDVRLTGQNGQVSSFSANIAGGGYLGTFLVVDGTDPAGSEVYFSHMGANSDGNDHAKALGNNTFGFEDLAGLGDRDFNDVVVKFAVV